MLFRSDQVIALVGTAAQTALPHHDEAGKKDSLNRNHRVEERKRYWIEVGNSAEIKGIDQDPGSEPHSVDPDKNQTADKRAKKVTHSLSRSAPR